MKSVRVVLAANGMRGPPYLLFYRRRRNGLDGKNELTVQCQVSQAFSAFVLRPADGIKAMVFVRVSPAHYIPVYKLENVRCTFFHKILSKKLHPLLGSLPDKIFVLCLPVDQ